MRLSGCLGLLIAVVVGCREQPAFLRHRDELSLLQQIESALSRSLVAEKSAVLAVTDDDSRALAAESRAASADVDRLLAQLRSLISADGKPAELENLAVVERAWGDVKALDEILLTLAVANTNLKAAAVSADAGATALTQMVDALVQASTRAADPAEVRDQMSASIGALRIQALLPPHIAAAGDSEMQALEARIGEQVVGVDAALARLAAGDGSAEGPSPIERARVAWETYQRSVREVLELSRENSNVRSLELSLHEKRRATEACRAAIAVLTAQLRAAMAPSR